MKKNNQMQFNSIPRSSFWGIVCLAALITHHQDITPGFAQVKTEDQQQTNDADQEKEPEPFKILFAEDRLQMTVSGKWKKIKPKSNMIEVEIQLAKLDDDPQDGRLTIMGAGGSIDANISRWEGQFSKQDGKTKKKEEEIANQKVIIVDISGTFVEMPGGPFSGGASTLRENYRMLAAIIQTTNQGNYFLKLYGPKNTIDKNEKLFESMVKSLEVKK